MRPSLKVSIGISCLLALLAVWFIAVPHSGRYFRFLQSRLGVPTTPGPFLGRDVPPGHLLYHNPAYHFSLLYPDDLTVHSFGEGGGASTMTFEDPTGKKGFQIFVLPYATTTITAERFRKDNPSGVVKDLQEGKIDGTTTAEFFFSDNAGFGPAREIWFINDGYLYEVSAPAALDEWLLNIMTTWKFYDPGLK